MGHELDFVLYKNLQVQSMVSLSLFLLPFSFSPQRKKSPLIPFSLFFSLLLFSSHIHTPFPVPCVILFSGTAIFPDHSVNKCAKRKSCCCCLSSYIEKFDLFFQLKRSFPSCSRKLKKKEEEPTRTPHRHTTADNNMETRVDRNEQVVKVTPVKLSSTMVVVKVGLIAVFVGTARRMYISGWNKRESERERLRSGIQCGNLLLHGDI